MFIGLPWCLSQKKRLPAIQETWVRSLGWEDPLEKEMATHSSILAWKIPWNEEPGGYSPWCRKESDRTEQLHSLTCLWASLVAQMVKNLPAMQETWDWCLGQEDPLEKQWLPTLVFLLEEFQGQRILPATVDRVAKSHRVTKTQLSDFHFHFRCLYNSPFPQYSPPCSY